MLTEVLARQEMQLEALADAWLSSGAEGFGVWTVEEEFASWPEGISLEHPSLTASIEISMEKVGTLRVVGVSGLSAQTRLNLDAALVSDLLRLEDELDTMTSEFIDIQDQLLAIYDLTKSTRNRLNRAQTLELLASEAARLVKVEGAFLLLQESNRPLLWASDGIPHLTEGHLQTFLDMLPAIHSHRQLDSTTSKILPAGVDNLLLIPIQIRHGNAALALINQPSGTFTSPDIKLALTIADQAGAQIDLVLLHEETVAQTKFETEMKLAQNVQLNLLPKDPPTVEGLELWAGSRPALQVGGDFYDFIDEPGRPFIFAIGDVSGKGMPAAILMAMTRTVLRNGARFANPPIPEEFMRRANEDLYDDFTEVSMFVTVFVGRYDPDARMMHYANAGHSPVIYCPAGGKSILLEADGPAMGILPINLSENHTMPFNVGDLLVAGTDGFSEARNIQGEMFGYDRLLDLVEELGSSNKSAQDVANILFKTIEDFGASHMQDDDQTLVIVRGVAGGAKTAAAKQDRQRY